MPLPTSGTCEGAIFCVEGKFLEGIPVNNKMVREGTLKSPIVSCVLEYTRSGWPPQVDDARLEPHFNRRHELSVEQDCLMWGLRVIIPEKFQEQLLEELHMAHPGIVRMKELARSYIWWPGIDGNIEELVHTCASCQHVKSTPSVAPLMPWIWPSKP